MLEPRHIGEVLGGTRILGSPVRSLLQLNAAVERGLPKSTLRNVVSRVFSDAGDKPSGFASHEVGTIRMGKNPKTSVLNSYCQAHEVKNLFVTDGSCFTTSSEKNPTLTIMALSLRASEYIKEQRKKGEL